MRVCLFVLLVIFVSFLLVGSVNADYYGFNPIPVPYPNKPPYQPQIKMTDEIINVKLVNNKAIVEAKYNFKIIDVSPNPFETFKFNILYPIPSNVRYFSFKEIGDTSFYNVKSTYVQANYTPNFNYSNLNLSSLKFKSLSLEITEQRIWSHVEPPHVRNLILTVRYEQNLSKIEDYYVFYYALGSKRFSNGNWNTKINVSLGNYTVVDYSPAGNVSYKNGFVWKGNATIYDFVMVLKRCTHSCSCSIDNKLNFSNSELNKLEGPSPNTDLNTSYSDVEGNPNFEVVDFESNESINNTNDLTIGALGSAYIKIYSKYCYGYKVYVNGKYKLTENGDGYCAFYIPCNQQVTIKLVKDGCSYQKTR